jgi:hypothetical protein
VAVAASTIRTIEGKTVGTPQATKDPEDTKLAKTPLEPTAPKDPAASTARTVSDPNIQPADLPLEHKAPEDLSATRPDEDPNHPKTIKPEKSVDLKSDYLDLRQQETIPDENPFEDSAGLKTEPNCFFKYRYFL